jgi:hypothetical protein
MILFVNHPLVDNLVHDSHIPFALDHAAPLLLNLACPLEHESFPVQIKCLPRHPYSESAHYNVRAVLLSGQLVFTVTPTAHCQREVTTLVGLD